MEEPRSGHAFAFRGAGGGQIADHSRQNGQDLLTQVGLEQRAPALFQAMTLCPGPAIQAGQTSQDLPGLEGMLARQKACQGLQEMTSNPGVNGAGRRCRGQNPGSRRQGGGGSRRLVASQQGFGPTHQGQGQFPFQPTTIHSTAQTLQQFDGLVQIGHGRREFAGATAHGAAQHQSQGQVALGPRIPTLFQQTLIQGDRLLQMRLDRLTPGQGADQHLPTEEVKAGSQFGLLAKDGLGHFQGGSGLFDGFPFASQSGQGPSDGSSDAQMHSSRVPLHGGLVQQLQGCSKTGKSHSGIPVGQVCLPGLGQHLSHLPGKEPRLGALAPPGARGGGPVRPGLLGAANRLSKRGHAAMGQNRLDTRGSGRLVADLVQDALETSQSLILVVQAQVSQPPPHPTTSGFRAAALRLGEVLQSLGQATGAQTGHGPQDLQIGLLQRGHAPLQQQGTVFFGPFREAGRQQDRRPVPGNLGPEGVILLAAGQLDRSIEILHGLGRKSLLDQDPAALPVSPSHALDQRAPARIGRAQLQDGSQILESLRPTFLLDPQGRPLAVKVQLLASQPASGLLTQLMEQCKGLAQLLLRLTSSSHGLRQPGLPTQDPSSGRAPFGASMLLQETGEKLIGRLTRLAGLRQQSRALASGGQFVQDACQAGLQIGPPGPLNQCLQQFAGLSQVLAGHLGVVPPGRTPQS